MNVLDQYTYDYYTKNPGSREQRFWDVGQIRYGDQLAAIGYALGIESYSEIQRICMFTDGEQPHPLYSSKKMLEALWDNRTRDPGVVLDVGGGRGEITIGLSNLGIQVDLLDPTPDIDRLINETLEKLGLTHSGFQRWDESLGENHYYNYDTVIFCESIEHIPEQETRDFLSNFKGRLVVTNWIDFHPIELDGVGHITRIDDDFYNSLPGETVYMEGSHLIKEL